jgi:hypothetical protein
MIKLKKKLRKKRNHEKKQIKRIRVKSHIKIKQNQMIRDEIENIFKIIIKRIRIKFDINIK